MRKLTALLVLMLLATGAHAGSLFSIEPFKVMFEPTGPKSSNVFRFSNPSDDAAAIVISMQTWQQNPQTGAEVNTPAKLDFDVYPNQFTLPPRGTQAVRVTYHGPEDPPVEQAYRLVAEQLPVDFQQERQASAINFVLTYRAAVYVTPRQAQANVVVQDFRRISDTLQLTLANQGTAHALMTEPVLHLTGAGGKTLTLQGQAVAPLVDFNLHPNRVRTVALPWPAGITDLKALRFDFKPGF